MQLSIVPATQAENKPALPNLRDLADLVRDHLPPALVKLVPLDELTRRCAEIDLTMPRFREETPLVLRTENERRTRLANPAPVLSFTQLSAAL